MRSLLTVTSFALLSAVALPTSEAQAQACCGTPTVAYSPVVAAPTIAVQTQERSRLAKILDPLQIFSRDRVTTTVNYGGVPYTAGYTPYTAGYAPYSVGYAPTPYTAAYTPQVAYRPTYPATYGPVVLPQTVSRPVVLSPVVSAPACDACSACGGVEQAYYGAPSTGCSSCNAGASYEAPASGYNDSFEQRPTLAPDAQVAPERSIQQKPEVEESFDDDFGTDSVDGDPAAANEYWRAPPLYAPSNRVTQRSHPAPARTAVYRRPADVRQTAFRPTPQRSAAQPEAKVNRLDADGWEAVAN